MGRKNGNKSFFRRERRKQKQERTVERREVTPRQAVGFASNNQNRKQSQDASFVPSIAKDVFGEEFLRASDLSAN
jgi:hypothetical protein